MGSPVDSSIRESATGGALFSLEFAESGGYSRKETEELFLAVGYVSDDHRAFLAPEQLPPSAPKATGPDRLPGSSRLDKLYEPHFRRLDRGLEVLKAQPIVVPEVQIHVHSSVAEGYVAELGVLDVNAEGEVVSGSVLVERKAGVRK